MARPRTPTETLVAKGSFLRHPERKRARSSEPIPRPFGEAPKHLGKDEKKVWNELSQKLQPGVAGDSDETAFEVLVCLVVNFRRRRKSRLPEVVGELAQMNKLFVQFGMTPADRSRVSASPGEEKKNDPWSKLLPSSAKPQ